MSKGSQRRPQKVDNDKVRENWERIFGSAERQTKKEKPKPQTK
jgi:hypothetical protein